VALVLATAFSPVAFADGPAPCETRLVLGVPYADATRITTAFCQRAESDPGAGVFRVSIVSLGRGVVVTAARAAPDTGKERTVILTLDNVEAAVQAAPALAARLVPQDRAGEGDSVAARPATAPIVRDDPYPPAPAPPPTPASPPPSSSLALPGASTRVTLRSETSAQLQHQETDGQWATACMSPCGAELPKSGAYRVVDDSGHPLASFRLDDTTPNTTVQVSPRNVAVDALAITSVVVGGLAMGAGVLSAPGESSSSSSSSTLLGVGVAGVLLGVVGLAANRTTFAVRPSPASTTAVRAP
jgi:hypothetical protein